MPFDGDCDLGLKRENLDDWGKGVRLGWEDDLGWDGILVLFIYDWKYEKYLK